jgi:hypothetical protein
MKRALVCGAGGFIGGHLVNRLKSEGFTLKSFSSYTGGLVAPESNDNPWGYKFSWNPRNVIVAGQGTARYIANGKYHYLPYNRLFKEIERIDIEKMRSALMGALSATSQAIPQMAAQGQDPSDIVMKIAEVIDARRNGKTVEDSVISVFKKPEPEPQPEQQAPNPMDMMSAMGGMGGLPQAAPGEGAPVEAQGPETMGGAPVEASPGATPPPGDAAMLQEVLARLGGQ